MARPKKDPSIKPDPRMSMAFYHDHMKFCKEMAGRHRLSVTQYVNGLIAKEMKKHKRSEWDRLEQIEEE